MHKVGVICEQFEHPAFRVLFIPGSDGYMVKFYIEGFNRCRKVRVIADDLRDVDRQLAA